MSTNLSTPSFVIHAKRTTPPLDPSLLIARDRPVKTRRQFSTFQNTYRILFTPKITGRNRRHYSKTFSKIVQNINRNQYITIRLERNICNTNVQKRFKERFKEKTGKLQTNQFNISPLQNITENKKRQNSRTHGKHTVCLTFTSTVLDQNTRVSHNY